MIDGCEVISEVRALIVESVVEGSSALSEQRRNSVVTDDAPLLCLDVVELSEDRSHSVAVASILKLIKVNIVEDAEIVEQRRYHSARGRH